MKRVYSCLLFFLFLYGMCFAQDYKRTFNWYFGDSAGVNFNTTPPTSLSNGKMRAIEGCATISDTSGNLLFYSNGETIWSKNHQVMDNGTGMLGDYSSTQSSLIVPQPGNDSIYYMFTTGSTGGAFRYNIINLNQNGGLGKVIKKNVLVQAFVSEKLTSTYHQNGKDIWVLIKGFGDNKFYAYLLTSAGLKICPVISTAGSVHTTQFDAYAQGGMKFSGSGKRLAVTQFSNNSLEIFYFDKDSGIVQPSPTILSGIYLPYGIEFSPNEKIIYASDKGQYLYQFDLNAPNPNATNFIVATAINWRVTFKYRFQSIQLASNGKIYVAFLPSDSLCSINNPDSTNASCGFEWNGISLNGKNNQYGLPNFVSSYFFKDTLLNFSYDFVCPGQQAVFKAKNNVSSVQWTITKQYGSGSTTYNTSIFTHTFIDTGVYLVKLLSGSDSIIKTVRVGLSGQLITSTDTLVCQKDSIALIANPGYECYWWNDSMNVLQVYAKATGTYQVTAWNNQGCKLTDSIRVRLFQNPPDPLVKPLADTIRFCKGTLVNLIADSGAAFHWQDGYPFASRIIDTTGLFYTSWTDSFTCQRNDTTHLLFYPLTQLQKPLPDSVTFCIGQTITLSPDSGTGFHWQDNYPMALRTIDTAGLFFTSWADTFGCMKHDSILIKTYSVIKPVVQRLGDSLFASGNFAQWQWLFNGQPINGANFTRYKALQNGFYKVQGTDTGSCIAVSDSVNITNVSIRQLISPNEISVFPNPVNNVLHIELNTATEKLQSVYLLNSTGQLVYCETSPNPSEAEINCSALPKGLYLLSLTVTNKTYYQRIIIQ